MKTIFNQQYDREKYLNFLEDYLLPNDFQVEEENVTNDLSFKPNKINEITYLGKSDKLGIAVYEMKHKSEHDPRVTLSREAFKIMANFSKRRALVFFVSDNADNYRFSLITIDLKLEGNRVTKLFSNPRRLSFYLGKEAKIHTPEQFLYQKGRVKDFNDLQERFSIEIVNKEFYQKIQFLFYKLVGGKVKQGSHNQDFEPLLKLPSTQDHKTMQEFSVRLVGRLVFCWFLKKKKSNAGIPLIPAEILSAGAIKSNYYHKIIEPLFFEILNTPIENRNENFRNENYDKIPFLNGGLFDPNIHQDYYAVDDNNITLHLNTLNIPDEWLKEFINLLETYNFTIDENTSIDIELSVDPEMLGRIFENLLAEINPQTGNSARKSTGSYYTPRPIVEYMVDESIIQYLVSKTKIVEQKIKELLDYNISDTSLDKAEKIEVINAIDDMKVLDPACGSGAFPMGILQKLVLVLEKVDPDSIEWVIRQLDKITNEEDKRAREEKFINENWQYKSKMGIIQNTIYGVDIQSIATEISKLRLFLTLIVDENVDDNKLNRNIHPLPNLSFKFVTANSLVDLGDEDETMIKNLKMKAKFDVIREKYFSASSKESKKEIEFEFGNLQKELLDFLTEPEHQQTYIFDDFTEKKAKKKKPINSYFYKLLNWNPFKDEPASWFNPKWMFGVEDGFDIIIGNPPYIGEKGNKDIFTPLKNSSLGKRFYQGKMDIFYFFFHLGLDLLKNNGINSFITTNYYITATGAKNLRNDFKKRSSILKILNFGEFKIFESASGQHNMVSILQKGYDSQKEVWAAKVDRKGYLKNNINILRKVLSGADDKTEYYEQMNKTVFYEEDNYIGFWPKEYSRIFAKVIEISMKLDVICKVNQGLRTGADFVTNKHRTDYKFEGNIDKGIFVLNKADLIEINSSTKLIKSWFKNSDIQKYQTKSISKSKLIFSEKDKTEIEMKVKYPKIYQHLLIYKDLLIKIRKRNNERIETWYCLDRPRDPEMYECPKIVAPQRSTINTFGYNEVPWYASADVYFITHPHEHYSLKYILGILNSKLIYKWLFYRGKRKGAMLELYQKPLSEIPIAKAKAKQQNVIVEIVDQILQKKEQKEDTTHLENQIDLMVYKLYELTYEEVKIIDAEFDKVLDEFGLSKEDYAQMSVEELGELEV